MVAGDIQAQSASRFAGIRRPVTPVSQGDVVTQETRYWRAVEQRDARFDGQFVYAVRSTGVYCRPSCPSRRPSRAGVLFFQQPESAERQGFRACRRCGGRRPDNRDDTLAAQICRYIDQHLEDEGRITLAALAAAVHKSPFHLQRAFKRAMGVSPREYAEARRLGQWKKHLRRGRDVTAALYEAGYGSSSRLYEKASSRLGMTPGAYRQGGAGMKIDYVIADCSLGRVLVGFTERGVSAVYLGDKDKPLETALHDEYPRAEIHREEGSRGKWVGEILAYLRGQQPQLNLPLDLAATAFQMRVWEELRRIPYGATRTYKEIAGQLGQPNATRAVARACATNPVSIVVPCHRVVRSDGGLAGYRWGLGRKEALLEREQAAPQR
jgi:AraC family transcriptional regulator, regulatory protein of adaptative response / methylated-DNA-[protein]-cysteine methyltransferase